VYGHRKELNQKGMDDGIEVIHRTDENQSDVAEEIASIISFMTSALKRHRAGEYVETSSSKVIRSGRLVAFHYPLSGGLQQSIA